MRETLLSHNVQDVVDLFAADRAITKELDDGLQHVGVRVLDHLVVSAADYVSMAPRGLL